jgi:hypothetical protein
MLITPGDRSERLARAVTLPADSVVFGQGVSLG